MSVATTIFRLAGVDFDHFYFETAVFWRVQNILLGVHYACYAGACYSIVPNVLRPFLQRFLSTNAASNVLRLPQAVFLMPLWSAFLRASQSYPLQDSPDVISRVDLGEYQESSRSWPLQIVRRIIFGVAAATSGFFLGKSLFSPLERWHRYAPAAAFLAIAIHDGLGEWADIYLVPKLLGYINPRLEDFYWFPRGPLRDAITSVFSKRLLFPARRRLWNHKTAAAKTFLGTGSKLPRHQYLPIQDPRTIRILALKADSNPCSPRDEAVSIIGHLEIISIDDNPEYEAISYVWGNPTLDHSLTVGLDSKAQIPITKSVYELLQALTPLSGEKKFWIDAVCINQQDSIEKAQQVSLMRSIYGRAHRVLAFIQDDSGENSLSLLLNRLVVSSPTLLDLLSRDFPGDRDDLDRLTKFLRNPYWRRVWIIQELAMARRITLYYNYSPLPWSALIRCESDMKWIVAASKFWEWSGPTTFRWEDVFELTISLVTIPKLIELYLANVRIDGKRVIEDIEEHEKSIVDIVDQFRNSGATQAVDKVYALLGISDDGNLPQIQPDYQKELWKVYASVAELALNSRSFELFSLAGYHRQLADAGGKNTEQLLPSWVPNFNDSSPLITTRKYHERGYAAGTSRFLQFEIIPQTRQLQLKGVRFDRIKQCSEPVGSYSLLKVLSQKISAGHWEDIGEVAAVYCDSLKHVVRMLDSIPRTYHGGISRNEALWRTVVEDYDGVNHPANSTIGNGFQDTLIWLRLFEILVDSEMLDDSSTLKRIFSHEKLGQLINQTMVMIGENADQSIEEYLDEDINSGHSLLAGGSMLFFSHACFAITEKGYMAVVPHGTKSGDIIMVPLGSPAPQILRPSVEDEALHYFCGETYVHGIMRGEAMDASDAEEQWFTLI
jgi:hypothetical protein